MRDGDMSGEFTMRSLCDAPELAAYRDEPQQLPAGAPGKDGFLRLGFEHRDGRSVLSELAHRAPLLAQQKQDTMGKKEAKSEKKKKKAAKTNAMFASRDTFSYTEEEIAEYERLEGDLSKSKRPKRRNDLGDPHL